MVMLSYSFHFWMFDVGQTLAQQNTGNKPVFIFCSLVKFTSYFIQRILYCNTFTQIHTKMHKPPSLFYESAKNRSIKNSTQTRWVCSLQAARAFSSGSRRSRKSRARTSYDWSKFSNNQVRLSQLVEQWGSLHKMLVKNCWLTMIRYYY